MNRLYKTDTAVFEYSRFSLFLKDPFFRLFTHVLTSVQVMFHVVVVMIHAHCMGMMTYSFLIVRSSFYLFW